MAAAFTPLRSLSKAQNFKKGDLLVVFGEVFQRGYVNGLIEEAKDRGMDVVFGTVGRRDENDQLRPLNADELAQKDQPLINVPLEAGFDLEKSSAGRTPVDQLQGLKLSEWDKAKLNWDEVAESRESGRRSFESRVREFLSHVEKSLKPGQNVLFAHTMAGGVPRAKIILPVMNRVFKGSGERFASSKEFWDGELGRFCAMSFMDVTANTFDSLIRLSKPLRDKVQSQKGQVGYVAYGYHGTEILIQNQYRWQSYSPYLQGFAKVALEDIAIRAQKEGVSASVYNAPEILTNSSSIFLGVEVALYPLLGAFRKEAPTHPFTRQLLDKCQSLLKPEYTLDDVLTLTNQYFDSEIIAKRWSDYPSWPQHNGPEQMKLMRETSQKILDMHKDQKHLLTAELSEVVFKACGKAMVQEGFASEQPVWWIGHDLVVKLSIED